MPHVPLSNHKKDVNAHKNSPPLETAEHDALEGVTTESPSAGFGGGLSLNQKNLLTMQRTQGNSAVQRYLAGRGTMVQRDPPAAGAPAAAAPSRYNPPPYLLNGRIPAQAVIDDQGEMPEMADRVLSIHPAYQDASFGAANFMRQQLARDRIRENFVNMMRGSSYSFRTEPVRDFINEYSGMDVVVRARVTNVRFMRADGVNISSTSTSTGSGASAGSVTQTTTVGATGTAGQSAEAPVPGGGKAGNSQSGSVTASSATASAQGATGTVGGSTARGTAPNASCVFSFDVEYSVTATYHFSPRTWSSIMSLGIGNIAAEISGNQSQTYRFQGTGGQVRVPVVDCTPA